MEKKAAGISRSQRSCECTQSSFNCTVTYSVNSQEQSMEGKKAGKNDKDRTFSYVLSILQFSLQNQDEI